MKTGGSLPLYEYRCPKCGKLLEKIQKFSDPPLKTCRSCGGRLERLVSSPAIQFKGSGWYVTDYARKPSASESAKTDSSSAGKTESSTNAKSDGAGSQAKKPAKASDSKPSSKE